MGLSLLYSPRVTRFFFMRNRNIKRLSLRRSVVIGIGSGTHCRSETHLWATARLHSQGHAHLYSVANSTLLTYNKIVSKLDNMNYSHLEKNRIVKR